MVDGFTKTNVKKPRSVGERLRALRLRRALTLADIEAHSKVRSFFIEAIEQSQFGKLPATVYCLGFLRAITASLGVPYEKFETDFKAEHELWLKIQGTGFDHTKLMAAYKAKFVVSPKVLAFAGALFSICIGVGYLYYQVASFLTPPMLEIVEPANQAKLTGDTVKLIGHTTQGASVTINGQQIVASPDGTFSEDISLTPGINELEVSSATRFNKKTTKQIKILRERSQAQNETNQTGS